MEEKLQGGHRCPDREALERGKLESEMFKLDAERRKLLIEHKKLLREFKLYPWFIGALMTTSAVAALKLLLDQI